MKLWNKNDELNKKIENFTIGNDRINDLYLAKYDIIGSIAHAKMLCKINILNTNELNKLLNELKKINNDINNGTFEIE